jgi:hypothetical protein
LQDVQQLGISLANRNLSAIQKATGTPGADWFKGKIVVELNSQYSMEKEHGFPYPLVN